MARPGAERNFRKSHNFGSLESPPSFTPSVSLRLVLIWSCLRGMCCDDDAIASSLFVTAKQS
jgi:hypothetical protein